MNHFDSMRQDDSRKPSWACSHHTKVSKPKDRKQNQRIRKVKRS